VIVVQMIVNDGLHKHKNNHGRPVDPIYGSYERSGLTAAVAPTAENRITVRLPK
jgi:hypothetical protein